LIPIVIFLPPYLNAPLHSNAMQRCLGMVDRLTGCFGGITCYEPGAHSMAEDTPEQPAGQ